MQYLWSPFRHWNRPTWADLCLGDSGGQIWEHFFLPNFVGDNQNISEAVNLGLPIFSTNPKKLPNKAIPPRAEPRTTRVFQGCCCTSARGRRGSSKWNTCSGHSREAEIAWNSAFPCLSSSSVPCLVTWFTNVYRDFSFGRSLQSHVSKPPVVESAVVESAVVVVLVLVVAVVSTITSLQGVKSASAVELPAVGDKWHASQLSPIDAP